MNQLWYHKCVNQPKALPIKQETWIWNRRSLQYFSNIFNGEKILRQWFIENIQANWSGKQYGEHAWSQYSWWWTTPKVSTPYALFLDQHPHLHQSAFDIGLIQHLEFMNDLSESDFETVDSIKQALIKKLWTIDVWRGMMLTEEEIGEMQEIGIRSSLFRFLKENTQESRARIFEDTVLCSSPWKLIDDHLFGANGFSPFLSISSFREVAMAIWARFGKKGMNRRLVLSKIRIPAVDIISFSTTDILMPEVFKRVDWVLQLKIDGIKSEYSFHNGAERFIYGVINPEEIISIEYPDISEVWSHWITTKLK